MNAVISGQSGVAVLVDGSRLASIQAVSDGEIVERRPQEIRFLLNDARDLEFVEDVETEEIVHRLQVATTKYDALHTALILLDRDLSHDTRRTAAEELDEDLADEGIARWVEGVLFAHPLPKSGDISGARSACTGRTARTRSLIERLGSLQGVIAEVHQAWEAIPTNVFGTPEERQHALSVAVKHGLFRHLVSVRTAGKPVEDFVSLGQLNAEFRKIPNSEQILVGWVATLPADRQPWPVELDVAFVAESREERARILHDALAELPPQMRQAVILRVDQDLKYREIADVMRVSIETVKAHLYQARQHLKDKLGDYLSDLEL